MHHIGASRITHARALRYSGVRHSSPHLEQYRLPSTATLGHRPQMTFTEASGER